MKFFDEKDNPASTGSIDRFIRRFSSLSYALAVIVVYVVAASAVGLALVPSLLLMRAAGAPLWAWESWLKWPALGVLGGSALFLAGFALLIVVPIYNLLLPTRLRPFDGGYFTVAAVPWYLHNALFYLVRFTFLPFVTMTPIGILFLRAMGMKLGRRVRISSEMFSDPSLITLGDDVVIGGSATLYCHYGGAGRLVIAPIVVGDRATIGEKATIMGDVIIGEGATILAHSVLLPGTRVGARERWGGVPSRLIPPEEWKDYKATLAAGG